MKTIIIDDERLARKELFTLLEEFDQIEVVAEAANADEAIAAIEQYKPDLIFLDIQMPGKSGFELLDSIEFVPHVIFVTAFDEYAMKAFEVNALDYLLKPVESERLAEAIRKVEKRLMPENQSTFQKQSLLGPNDRIFLKDGEKCWFVTLNEVRLFESEGNYVRVYFKNFKPLILKSLNSLEEKLDERTFFRASRKHIVNLQWVEHIETWFNGGLRVTLKDSTQLEVSRRQAARFKELLSL